MSERKKVSLPYLFKKVANNEPITMLTCYDYPTAHFQEIAEIDMILVGDSLGMTMLGWMIWSATQKLCALAPQIPG
jgi:3-methyl-2-oxobutanoate hydroxymethyltransferase